MKITPRDYQKDSVDAMIGFAKSHDPSEHAYVNLPTGAGKSVVIADFCERLAKAKKRVLVLCRQGELVQQNAERLEQLSDGVKVGIYSASLGRKEVDAQVIFATVQSVARNIKAFRNISCVLIDEVHQVPQSESSQYGTVIKALREDYSKCRVFGLTATPYRLASGMIHGEGKLFHECVYEVPLKKMLDDGHITPWRTPDVRTVDVSGVKIKGGEYDTEQLSEAFIEKVEDNAREIIALSKGRERILVFASSVAHAEALESVLRASTASLVTTVTGETDKDQRASIIKAFGLSGTQMFLINVGVFTTGFDAPNVDCVAICRATKSAGLFYQILGRGMRRCEGKEDFLVLDFGGNFEEHGDPIDINFGRSEEKDHRLYCDDCDVVQMAEADSCSQCGKVLAHKECLGCGSQVPKNWKVCKSKLDQENLFSEECGFDFMAKRCRNTLQDKSPCLAIIDEAVEICSNCQNAIDRAIQEGKSLKNSCFAVEKQKPEWWRVEETYYALHVPKDENKPPTLRVTYKCKKDEVDSLVGKTEINGRFMEWVCLEHEGFAKRKAESWWRTCSKCLVPDSIAEAEALVKKGGVRNPSLILVENDGKWKRIVARKFSVPMPDKVYLDFEDEEPPF
jgi:DNA repair protein RadD